MIAPWMLNAQRQISVHQIPLWWALCAVAVDEPVTLSIASLAHASGLSRRFVMDSLADFEARGLIHRVKRAGVSGTIQVINQGTPRIGPVLHHGTGVSEPLLRHNTGQAQVEYPDDTCVPTQPVLLDIRGSRVRDLSESYSVQVQVQGHGVQDMNTSTVHQSYSMDLKDLRKNKEQEGGPGETIEAEATQVKPATTNPAATMDLIPPPDGELESIKELFTVWAEAVGDEAPRLTDKRKSIFRKLLKEHGLTAATLILRGLGLSTWHRENGQTDPRIALKEHNWGPFMKLAREASGTALARVDVTKGQSWDQIHNELLDRYQRARNALMHEMHVAINAGNIQPMPPEELAKFSKHYPPLGLFPFEGRVATVFPDGPTGTAYLMYIHSANATAALIAGDEMLKAYPPSEGMTLLTKQFALAARNERALQYAKTVKEYAKWSHKPRYVEIIEDADFEIAGGES